MWNINNAGRERGGTEQCGHCSLADGNVSHYNFLHTLFVMSFFENYATSIASGTVGAAAATAAARGLPVDNRVFLGGMFGGGGMTLMLSAESIV